MKLHKHAVAAGMILLTGLPVLLAEPAQAELPRGLAAIEGQVPERITENRLLWSGPVSGLKIRGDLPALGVQLDRKIYDSLDLTAQALVLVGEKKRPDMLSIRLKRGDEDISQANCQVGPIGTHLSLLLDFRGLKPAGYRLLVTAMGEAAPATETAFEIVDLIPAATRPVQQGKVPIALQPSPRMSGPRRVTTGVPFPRGAIVDPRQLRLIRDDKKTEVPVQVRVTARWSPRGYMRWALLDFTAEIDPLRPRTWWLEYGPNLVRQPVTTPVTVKQDKGRIEVNTGRLVFSVKQQGFSFLESARLITENGQVGPELVTGSRVVLVDESGTRYESAGDKESRVDVEEAGPLRVVLAARGWFVADGKRLGRYTVRMTARQGDAALHVDHTFVITESSHRVRYRGIFLETELPRVERRRFGLERDGFVEAQQEHAWLVQDDDETCRVVEQQENDRRTLARGGRAAGWVDTGNVTLSIRDFWQQYPKEFEIEGRILRAHFWPRHAQPPSHPIATISGRNIHRLWFAHEGELLDLRIPPDYAQLSKGRDEFYYIPSAIKNSADNGLGVAKTHSLCFRFHETPAERVAAQAREDHFTCGVLADPAWIDQTLAVGPLHPVDTVRFPDVETALSRHFDYLQRMQEQVHDYGMWNFGDRHSNWNNREMRPVVNRTWANHHHGCPRTYWLLYLRSGDPKYLQAARRHSMHLMDIDTCHWTTPEFEKLPYPRGKIRGALCDYKGLVHWHSGNRLYDYNNVTDFLFYHWYLDGYARAVDVAWETADAVASHPRPGNSGRDGTGPLSSLCFLYEATWDVRLLPQLETYATAVLGSQSKADGKYGAGYFGQWSGFAPWLPRYIRLTRDPAAVAALEDWCDWLSRHAFYGSGGAEWHDLAEGFRLLGKRQYLEKGVAEMKLLLGDQFLQSGHSLDGHFTNALTLNGGYFSQRMPSFLSALAKLKGPVVPRYGRSWGVFDRLEMGVYSFRRKKKPSGLPIVVLREPVDKNFDLDLKGRWGDEPGVPIRVVHVESRTVVLKTKIAGTGRKVTIPKDGRTGQYAVWFAGERTPIVQFPISTLPGEVVSWRDVYSKRMQALYFGVRPDVTEVEIDVAFGYDAESGSVHQPDGRMMARVFDERMWVAAWKRLRFTVPPSLRGKVLHFLHGRSHDEVNFQPVRGVHPWLAITSDRFFVPHRLVTEAIK